MNILNRETLLASGENRLGTPVHLVHRAAGQYPAGSRAVHKEEAWGVMWQLDNARHGRWHATPAKATADFDALNVAGQQG